MSIINNGITLKALLQDPNLLNYNQAPSVKDDLKKKKDPAVPVQSCPGQSAFLGPTIWDQTLPADLGGAGDFFKLEHLDIDDFLSENHIPSNEELNRLVGNLEVEQMSQLSQGCPDSLQETNSQEASLTPTSSQSPLSPTTSEFNGSRPNTPPGNHSATEAERLGVNVRFTLNDTDLAVSSIPGEKQFDPRKRTFSVDELRPQPVIKKSKKIYVTEEQKDDKYWQRRTKNNVAAKRSRDARRIKENQITLRAGYLETENNTLKAEMKKLKKTNEDMMVRLAKYEKLMPELLNN